MQVLEGTFTEGDTVIIDAGAEGLTFSRQPVATV
jgi:hypothetical protein